ncbi:CAP domain-containing protein [Patulibacter brassicae]|uniref:CAP domain-containing protein n=1 Tax=Patulibacter brassicae TaxID=1705717 RepID=A0ABU4VLD9_9ACTN|nr:CAP domain-containing protein [Patulibacter brassicae]MDX8152638.1 CAP domain-containing protein [Patulibacter brassicae]
MVLRIARPTSRPAGRAAALGVVLGLALAGPAAAQGTPSGCADADLPATSANVPQLRAAVLCLVNNERVARGVAPLAQHPALELGAQRHSDDMLARRYFDHTAPAPAPHGATIADRAAAAGYAPWTRLGENIAMGNDTARRTVLQWLRSPGHCVNMLRSSSTELGVGIATGPRAGSMWPPVWTQSFGARTPTTITPASQAAIDGCNARSFSDLVTPEGAGTTTPGAGTSGSDTTPGAGGSSAAPGAGSGTPPRVRVTSKLRRLSGGRYRITGRVTPRGATKRVRVRLARGTRSRSARVAVRASGAYRATLRAPAGRGRVRVTVVTVR